MSTNNYGEPWKFNLDMDAVPITRADGTEVIGNCEINEPDLVRAVTCVNACADIPDPAASIPYLVTLAKIAQDLAEWSDRWPRRAMYSANNDKMDEELIELEERAKAAVAVFNA